MVQREEQKEKKAYNDFAIYNLLEANEPKDNIYSIGDIKHCLASYVLQSMVVKDIHRLEGLTGAEILV